MAAYLGNVGSPERLHPMRSPLFACAFFAIAAATPALANMCRTDAGKTCATGMPIDGFCMCGNDGGTVVAGVAVRPHRTPAPQPAPPQR